MRLRVPAISRIACLFVLLAAFSPASWAAFMVTAGCPMPVAFTTQAYTFTVTYSGNAGAVTFTLNQALPPGLSLVSPGTISGTPTTPGVYPISINLQDAAGDMTSFNCNLTIDEPLTVTTPCPLPIAVLGVAYNVAITAAGGTGPYQYVNESDVFPPGLTLNNVTGVISGTPTTSGTYQVAIVVIDSIGDYYTFSCNLVVDPFLITATCPAPSGTVGVPYSFTVSVEGTTPVNWVLATDPLPPGLTLNTNTGVISGTPTTTGTYPIYVIVTGGETTQYYSCSITINPITITAPCPAPSGTLGAPYSFAITVQPLTSGVTWALTSGSLPPGLSLNPSTGVISGTPTGAGTYPFSVGVSVGESPPQVYSCSISINSFILTAPCPAPTGTVGTLYSFTVSVTLASSAPPSSLTWTLSSGPLPPGLTLNSGNGVISGTPTVAGTYPFSVTISGGGAPQVYSCSITISGGGSGYGTLQITTVCPITSLPVLLTATGGSGSYTFSIIGNLPPSLVLSANTITGQLSVDPAGYAFTLQVYDGETTAQEPCSISSSVLPSSPPVVITSGCPASPVAVGTPISFTLSATGGSGTYAWSITGILPAGLTLSGNIISGTPSGPPGTFQFTIQAASGGQYASVSCSITITPPKLVLTSSCPAATGTVGVAYGPFTLTASGGSGTFTFSIGGTLPPGVTLSGSALGGTPTTAGSYAFTITVTSGSQSATSPGCNVAIAPAPLQVTGVCPTAALASGSPVSISFTVTGGSPPYSYSLSGAAWLSVSSGSSTLTGTPGPTDAGSFSITLTVTDSAKASASFNCNLVVSAAPLKITGTCPANPVIAGSTLTVPLSATGGVPPYTWALTGNSGLSLSATQGASSGVSGKAPAVAGAYSFSVSLTDSAGTPAAMLNCSLTVQLPPLQITGTCPASALNLPVSLAIPLSAAGGQPPYAWTLSAPSWISLSSASGASTTITASGSPSAPGAFSISVTLNDSANSTAATLVCNSSINAPPVPPVTLTGLTLQGSLLTPAPVGVSVSSAPLLPLTGTVQLSFTPNAFGITDNPQVYFNGGSRTATFTIAPGQTSFALPAVQEGTDAGDIHLQVTDLQQGGVEVLPTPAPSADLVIPREAPVIGSSDVSFANETANGFDVVISGFSTPRDMQSVTLTFTAASGSSLGGMTSFTVDVSSLFMTYYNSAASQMVGSQWTSLYVPVTVTGNKNSIASVSVTLANSAGNSQTVTLPR